MDSSASPSPPAQSSSSSPSPSPPVAAAAVDDATTQQGLTLLRAYLLEEVQEEPYEDQVEETRRKQREKAKEDTLIEWGAQRPDVSTPFPLGPRTSVSLSRWHDSLPFYQSACLPPS